MCLLTESYLEEGKNKAGMGQGEEDVGKALRKTWTSCSIRLSIARYSPMPVGSEQALGRSTEVRKPLFRTQPFSPAPPPAAHTLLYLHPFFLQSLCASAGHPLLLRSKGLWIRSCSDTGDRKCCPSSNGSRIREWPWHKQESPGGGISGTSTCAGKTDIGGRKDFLFLIRLFPIRWPFGLALLDTWRQLRL